VLFDVSSCGRYVATPHHGASGGAAHSIRVFDLVTGQLHGALGIHRLSFVHYEGDAGGVFLPAKGDVKEGACRAFARRQRLGPRRLHGDAAPDVQSPAGVHSVRAHVVDPQVVWPQLRRLLRRAAAERAAACHPPQLGHNARRPCAAAARPAHRCAAQHSQRARGRAARRRRPKTVTCGYRGALPYLAVNGARTGATCAQNARSPGGRTGGGARAKGPSSP
jgi:hypothetical protein